jgi:ADP-ribose pyrophosphatase YjhB (NUDIX family)
MSELKRPDWPRPGASAVVLRGDAVLLVRRAKALGNGLWSLPGGHIEPGETAAAAARREVGEETGLAVEITGLAGVHDAIIRDGAGALLAHYVLAVYCARADDGTPVAASDVAEACFVPIGELDSYRLTPGARGLIERARALMETA